MKLLYLLAILILLVVFLNFSKSGFGNHNKPEVYIFVASWCGYCKKSEDMFKKLANNYDHVKIYDVDADGTDKLMEKYGVGSFPTIIKSDKTQFQGDRTYDSLEQFVNS